MQEELTKFLLNLSVVLAHSLVFEQKQLLSPGGIVDDARCEDDKAPSATAGTGKITQSVINNLPEYTEASNATILPTAQAELAASQAISPALAELMASLYAQYAPKLATTGAEVDAISRSGTAATDLDILQKYGLGMAKTEQGIDKTLNPEYYQNRTTLSNSLGDLLGSINLGNANPEAERLVAQENYRTGNLGNSSATNTVSNALSFGDQLAKRRSGLAEAISIGAAALPTMKTSFTGTNNLTVKGPTNTGVSQFTGVASPTSTSGASDLLSAASGVQTTGMNINANRRDWIDRTNESVSAVGSLC